MIILLNFGPTAPTHFELEEITNSCGASMWNHVMIPIEDRTPSEVAKIASKFAHSLVIEYYGKSDER